MNLPPAFKRKAGSAESKNGGCSGPLWLGLSALGNSVLCVLLLVATMLRETPEFWLNAGGYPVLLREAVLWLFYPCGLLCLAGVASGTWVSLKLLARRHPPGGLLLLLCLLQTLVIMAALAIMLWNNLNNLLDGAPLHQHKM